MLPADTPLVSVVITFLNEEKFLGEAIESVLQQTYTHWELLLVDDGSSDKSYELAQQYAAEHPGKIFVYRHQGGANKGLSASRNLGVQHASGKLVAFLDADDIWLPQKLEQQVSIARQHPDVGLIAEASLHWYNWCDPEKENCVVYVGAPSEKVYEPFQLTCLLYPLGKGAAPGPCSWMLTKEAIDRVGGFEESFNKQYQLYEDQAFLSKIYLQEQVYVSAACNNWYRQRQGSIMQAVKAKGHYHEVRRYFLEWLEQYAEKKNVHNKKLQQLLKKALMPYRNPRWYFFTRTVPAAAVHFSKRVVAAVYNRFIKKPVHIFRNA